MRERPAMLLVSIVAAVLLLGSCSSPVRAQALNCLEPATPKAPENVCVLRLPAGQRTTTMRFVVVDKTGKPAPTTPVRIEMPGLAPVDKRTDEYGEVRIDWTGAVGSAPLDFTVSATHDGVAISRPVSIRVAPTLTSDTLTPHPTDAGDGQYWYQERQLRKPVRVVIQGPDIMQRCRQSLVLFRQTTGGSTSPDSVYSVPEGGRCVASATWRLGKEVGEQHMRAGLPNEPEKAVLLRGYARALPRLIGGLAATFVTAYDSLGEASRRTFRVERVVGNETVAYDSVAVTRRIDHASTRLTWAPIVGVDWPIWHSWSHVRAALAASARNPTTEFFVGLSVLQPLFGISAEAVGVDLQFVVNVSRRRGITDLVACARDIADCDTAIQTRISGAGVMLSVDGTSLLTKLVTAFGG